jgi:CRP/FNR family transcriptional regulator, cyclic AMP receptor protein
MPVAPPVDLSPLTQSRWFQPLPAEFAQALLALGHVRTLAAGQALFLRESPPCGLYGIVSGSVRFSGHGGQADASREALLAVLTPGDWFGEIGLFDAAPRTHDAHAGEDSTLLHVGQADLLEWLQDHPAHWRDLGLLMADKLRAAFVNMEAHMLLAPPQRLAQRLLLLAQGHAVGEALPVWRPTLNITQDELARMLGLSRQTVNQILQNFKESGLIGQQRGELQILDAAALRERIR